MKRYNPLFYYQDTILSENRFPKHQHQGIDYLKHMGISSFDIERLLNFVDNGANVKAVRAFLASQGLTAEQINEFLELYNF